jgi:hypothetical protein
MDEVVFPVSEDFTILGTPDNCALSDYRFHVCHVKAPLTRAPPTVICQMHEAGVPALSEYCNHQITDS